MSTRETSIHLFNHFRRMSTNLQKWLRPRLTSGENGELTPLNTLKKLSAMILHLKHICPNFILKNQEMQMKVTWFWRLILTFSKFVSWKCLLKHFIFIRPILKSAISFSWKLFILKNTKKSYHNRWYRSAFKEPPVATKFQQSMEPSVVASFSKCYSEWWSHFTIRSTD